MREVPVNGFWIDGHLVTNQQFARFAAANGYVTIAEQPADAARYPSAWTADRTGHERADDSQKEMIHGN